MIHEKTGKVGNGDVFMVAWRDSRTACGRPGEWQFVGSYFVDTEDAENFINREWSENEFWDWRVVYPDGTVFSETPNYKEVMEDIDRCVEAS